MNKYKLVILSIVAWSMWAVSCTTSEYDKAVTRELASGKRYDSLFLGISFKMDRKIFFAHCWELNKKEIIRQGPSNLSVQYQLDSTKMKFPAYMWFYPEFKDNKINRMPVDFSYIGWAPWLQEMSNDSLILDTKRLLEKWYGSGFFLQENIKKDKHVWVKIDGNRRILIYPKTISTVHVDFLDLTNPPIKPAKANRDEETQLK